MKYDVFISYRRESGIFQAETLAGKLERKIPGCRIFLDRYVIKGEDWKKKLSDSIRESCNFVVLLTGGCFPHKGEGTDFFLYEIDLALRLGKTVIPVYYGKKLYDDFKGYLSEIDGFRNRNHIIFDSNNMDGSVDLIIKFLKTEDEVLHEQYELLSRERMNVRKELLLHDKSNGEPVCLVCGTRHSAAVSYCGNCGYKFFDELEKSVVGPDEQLQESERLEKHKEVWRRCMDGENTAGLRQELTEARERLQHSDSQRRELEKQLKAFRDAARAPSIGKETHEFHLSDKVSFKMIRVAGGSFMMGSPNNDPDAYDFEKPQHEVTLSDYYIGETQVTQALWKAVMGKTPSRFKGDNNPVERVSWDDCQEFINQLNSKTGLTFRLPTEAEWEYAARGGNKSRGYKYAGGDDSDEVAWYGDNSESKTHPVKQKKANELGLYDMSGNVWEWCQDWFARYDSDKETNPTGPSEGSDRVLRGGSWGDGAQYCREACRVAVPVYRGIIIGFRLALVQP